MAARAAVLAADLTAAHAQFRGAGGEPTRSCGLWLDDGAAQIEHIGRGIAAAADDLDRVHDRSDIGGAQLLALIDRYADLRTAAHRRNCRNDADMHAKRAEAASVRVRIRSRLSLLQDDAADYRLVSEEVAGKLIGDGWDDDAAEVAIVLAWAAHMAAVHSDCAGRFCEVADGGVGPGVGA